MATSDDSPSKASRPRLFLLDGTALAYRSHFALARSGLSTASGRPTGAVYGFTMTLRRILEQEAPDAIAVAMDPKGPTFRHATFAEYKATREKAPEEMIAQLDDIREVVRAHGISLFEVPGFEADDVLGTLTVQGEAAGWDVSIVTGDKDLMQLVGDHVLLYNVFKRDVDLVIEDAAAVEEKFGTTPEHVIDVLAIMGDSSDNVPGVKGIGEKGAKKLIGEFGSVAGVLENLDSIKGKAREYIERDREQLLMSLDLVTIRCEVPLDPGFASVGAAAPDDGRLVQLFRDLDFRSLAKKVAAGAVQQVRAERDYVTVTDAAGLEAMEAELRAAGAFAFDTETTSLFPLEATLVGASFCACAGRAFYVPFNQEPPVLPGGPAELIAALRPLLTEPGLSRWAQNWKYDALVFAAAGLTLPPPDFDTMVASFCAAGGRRRHNLDELALYFFDLMKIATSEIIGSGKNQVTMADVPIERVSEYACEDAEVTFRLRAVLEDELDENGARGLLESLELPLVPVLARMEERGIRLNTELLSDLSKELAGEMDAAAEAVQDLAGERFNVNSTKVLGQILFEKLRIQEAAGVKRPKRTKTGWATDQGTLTDKYGEVPIVRRLLEYREVAKLKSTYTDALPQFVNPATGRIHCSFSQVAAATGRLASSDPNLQNIPIRTERGRRLREAFVPREPGEPGELGEWTLLCADYSQVELRVMAHFTQDPGLLAAFERDEDIHTATAAVIFDIMPALVTRELRGRAKAINFGLLYGMGPVRLARETGLSTTEARQFIERYFKSFPAVRRWIDQTLASARETGYVETLLGRRRYFPELTGKDQRRAAFAENAAVNTPIQGSAADIIKRAMLVVEERLAASTLSAQLLLQVHDELVFELPLCELAQTRELVCDAMEGCVDLKAPLKVDCGHGPNWLAAH
ncbi:MAG: DNA polymerase I [Planctomycetota bacterium]|jgi:DNA polymerase-1|nr:DNA polymerase I [Planctomycetota bacterium]MDP6838571.1 DNA polymerase I [Planctomycetota bacterium]